MNTNKVNDFISRFNEELIILDKEGFFSGNNWTYTVKDILSLYDNLPNNLKKECIDIYPKIIKRIKKDIKYIDSILLKNNPELEGFVDKFHGKGTYDNLSLKMKEDYLMKKEAANTGMARYYILFLLIMNSQDVNTSPRVVIERIKSFKDFFEIVQGLPLFKDLKYLSITGNVFINSFVEYKNNVEIIVDPAVEYTLAGESKLDNIKLLIDNKGQVVEKSIYPPKIP